MRGCVALASLAALALTACDVVEASKELELSADASTLTRLTAELPRARVSLIADASDDAVSVTGRIVASGADQAAADALLEEAELVLTPKADQLTLAPRSAPSEQLHYVLEIHAPRSLAVRLLVGEGDLAIEGSEAELEARTSAGSLYARALTGELQRLSASNGELVLDGVSGEDVEAIVVSGVLRANYPTLTQGAHRLGAKGGDVELVLGSAVSVTLTAQVEGGSASCAHPGCVPFEGGFRIGSGTATMELAAQEGDVLVR